jgi:hypothetical protein
MHGTFQRNGVRVVHRAHHRLVIHGSEKHVHTGGDVSVGGDLAAIDGPREGVVHRLPPGLDVLLPRGSAQRRIAQAHDDPLAHQPHQIIVSDSRRDAPLDQTDSFQIILDTYLDQQNGFVFGTNPGPCAEGLATDLEEPEDPAEPRVAEEVQMGGETVPYREWALPCMGMDEANPGDFVYHLQRTWYLPNMLIVDNWSTEDSPAT